MAERLSPIKYIQQFDSKSQLSQNTAKLMGLGWIGLLILQPYLTTDFLQNETL